MARWSAAADEQRFREDAKIGDHWVQRIADQLRLMMLWRVDVPRMQIRAAFDQRREFRDDGDMFLNGHRIEVRSFGFRFTGPDDFPRKTVQVELATVMNAKANTVAYLFASRPTGQVVGLFGPELRRLDRHDGVWNARRQVARDWLVAPASKLVDWQGTVNYLADRCSQPVAR